MYTRPWSPRHRATAHETGNRFLVRLWRLSLWSSMPDSTGMVKPGTKVRDKRGRLLDPVRIQRKPQCSELAIRIVESMDRHLSRLCRVVDDAHEAPSDPVVGRGECRGPCEHWCPAARLGDPTTPPRNPQDTARRIGERKAAGSRSSRAHGCRARHAVNGVAGSNAPVNEIRCSRCYWRPQ